MPRVRRRGGRGSLIVSRDFHEKSLLPSLPPFELASQQGKGAGRERERERERRRVGDVSRYPELENGIEIFPGRSTKFPVPLHGSAVLCVSAPPLVGRYFGRVGGGREGGEEEEERRRGGEEAGV